MRGKGCRTIAATFNAAFANRGESVCKSYVANLRKNAQYQILEQRRALQKPPRPQKAQSNLGFGFYRREYQQDCAYFDRRDRSPKPSGRNCPRARFVTAWKMAEIGAHSGF